MDLFTAWITKKWKEEERLREEQRRQEAIDEAGALYELEQVVNQGQPKPQAPDQLQIDLPPARFTPTDRLNRSALIDKAGLDESKIIKTQGDMQRNQALSDILSLFRSGQNVNPQHADFVNNKSIAPVGFSGGTAYNKFDPENPILDENSAVTALADYRRNKASELQQRTNAIQSFIENPETHPLNAVRAVNKSQLPQPNEVVVYQDGKPVYYNQMPRVDGGFDYEMVVDPETDRPLSAPDNQTALMRDTAYRAETLGIPIKQALLDETSQKLGHPLKRWASLWEQAIAEEVKNVNNLELTKEEIEEKADETAKRRWSRLYPNEPLPILKQPTPPAPDSTKGKEARQNLKAAVESQEEARKTINGITYVKINGQWYEK